MLWALFNAVETHSWPSTSPELLGPALMIALFLPVSSAMTLGVLRRRSLFGWLAVVALFLAALGLHEASYGAMGVRQITGSTGPATLDTRFQIFPAIALALFIAQALVVAGDGERRVVAAYPTYFDVAWKQEMQLLLALLFLGLFWGILWLGAALFQLIGIDFLKNLISRASFAMPASTLAFAGALHLTDIRTGLVQGMRNLLHLLLSWLLPLAAVLILAFLASLPFTGLTPLWRTSHGSEIVLWAAAVLVVLINTAYRDGAVASVPAVLRWAGSGAALCLPVLVAISAYGLALRVDQHGWTETRIVAVACAVIGGCYAIGYVWAVAASARWLKRVEETNVATACVIVLTVAVLTTIADPARFAVMDQVARLRAGRIAPAQFDYKYLRFGAGRYGLDALDMLKNATWGNDEVKREVSRVLELKNRYGWEPPDATQIAAMKVYPPGQALPQSFVGQNWAANQHPYALLSCLTNGNSHCEAFVLTAADGRQVIILADLKLLGSAQAFAPNSNGSWEAIGSLSNVIACESVRQALRAGTYRWVVPLQMDLEIGDQRATIRGTQWHKPSCK